MMTMTLEQYNEWLRAQRERRAWADAAADELAWHAKDAVRREEEARKVPFGFNPRTTIEQPALAR